MASQGTANALRRRWKPDVRQKVIEGLLKGEAVSPFGHTEQGGERSVDLRGLEFDEVLACASLVCVDLSYAFFTRSGQFVDVSARRVSFSHADIQTNLSGDYEQCSFAGASLRKANFFSWGSFVCCDFSSADLSSSGGSSLYFKDCSFVGATLKGTTLYECLFVHCRWDHCRFSHASLSKSRITRQGFPQELGIQESGSILPDVILDNVQWLDWEDVVSRPHKPELANKKTEAAALAERARERFRQGDLESALSLFEQAERLWPLDSVSVRYQGLTKRRLLER